MTGDVYQQALEEKIAIFPEESRVILRKRGADRNAFEKEQSDEFFGIFVSRLGKVAKESDPQVRLRAIQLYGEIQGIHDRYIKTRGYRDQINYPYWKALANAEQEERTVRARRLVYQAEKANEEAELDKAISLYEEAFAIWGEIFDDYPILTLDDSAEDLYKSVRHYLIAIDTEEIPDDFPLKTFVEMMSFDGRINANIYAQVRAEAEEKLAARKAELAEEERQREIEANAASQAEEMEASQGSASDDSGSEESASKDSGEAKADESMNDSKAEDAAISDDSTSKDESTSKDSKPEKLKAEESKPEEAVSEKLEPSEPAPAVAD